MNYNQEIQKANQALRKKVAKDPVWQKLKYGEYDHKKIDQKFSDIEAVFDSHISHEEVVNCRQFIDEAFQRFYHQDQNDDLQAKAGFVVPTRVSRKYSQYGDEVTHFLPTLQYLEPDLLQRALVGMPPAAIENYTSGNDTELGLVLFAPVFIDMLRDMWYRTGKVKGLVRRIVNDTVEFARNRFGVEMIGLGATLPGLTRYGTTIDVSGVTVTTGHAGTVWLIQETLKKALQESEVENINTIGVLGVGSIGRAAAKLLLDRGYSVILYDSKWLKLRKITKSLQEDYGKSKVKRAKNLEELSAEAPNIVSAINGSIDLAGTEVSFDHHGYRGNIIDDSQPSCFEPSQIQKRGGDLWWVVAHGESAGLRRAGLYGGRSYNFGEDSGLAEEVDLWGCEAELLALTATEREDLAVTEPVKPGQIQAISEVMQGLGITVTPVRQHFGTRQE